MREWSKREIKDVRQDPFYQRQDIDFVVDGTTYEVKTDQFTTGNVFLETEAHGKPGAVFLSRAQVWCYCLVNMGLILYIQLPWLQQWLCYNTEGFKEVVTLGGKSQGVLVPVRYLESCPWVQPMTFDFAAKLREVYDVKQTESLGVSDGNQSGG